jgi:AcrR family transcriptional regulator
MANGRTSRDRRAEILDIAGPLFLENGYQGTSMSQIAAAVGGSKGTLYAYFGNKESLFEAYMQMRVRSKAADVFEFPANTDDVSGVLTRLGHKFLELVTEESSRELLRLLYHEAPRFPEIGRIFYETCLLRGRAQLTAYLIQASDAGALRVPQPELAAEQFLTLCQAKLVMPVMLCVTQGIGPDETEAVIKAAVAMFLAAYGAPQSRA